MDQEVLKGVVEVIVEVSAADESAVVPSARLADGLGLDSVDQIEIVMHLEEKFEVDIPDEAADKCQTVGDIVSMIERLQQHRK